jgi:hypothetical protein
MNGLIFEEDVQHTEPNETGHRRGQFHRGWAVAIDDSEDYRETTLNRLTWHNLGYRLGKLFGKTSDELIDQMYSWCVEQQKGM